MNGRLPVHLYVAGGTMILPLKRKKKSAVLTFAKAAALFALSYVLAGVLRG